VRELKLINLPNGVPCGTTNDIVKRSRDQTAGRAKSTTELTVVTTPPPVIIQTGIILTASFFPLLPRNFFMLGREMLKLTQISI
jgi:hypothetical protein